MDPFSAFGLPPLDPSKMKPELLMELSQLIQQLPPEQLGRMQTVMHNMQAGFDVRKDMEEFERALPPGFREKILAVISKHGQPTMQAAEPTPGGETSGEPVELSVREARLTVLRGVADGSVSPEEAERLLFSGGA